MTTYLQTLMHLIKGIIGAGIFSMGMAFRNGGMVLALIVTPIVGLLVLHSTHTLVSIVELKERNDHESKRIEKTYSYAELTEEVFLDGPVLVKPLAKRMKIVVNVFICFMLLGFCCVYVIFVGRNMKQIFDFYEINLDVHIMMLIFITPIWLSALITNLKWLSPVSIFANTLLITSVTISLYFICQDLPPLQSVNYLGPVENIPLYFGVVLQTFECIALIIPLRVEMDKPEQMKGKFGVLNAGFSIVTPLITILGCLAYLKYGEQIKGTIFLNLSQSDKLAQGLLVIVCLQVLCTFPIQMYTPVTIFWPEICSRFGPFKRPLLTLLCLRTIVVIFVLAVAEAIPFIDLIISLIGAVSSSALTLFIPSFMDIVTFYPLSQSTAYKFYLLTKNTCIIVFAVLVFVTGIYASIRDIALSFTVDNG